MAAAPDKIYKCGHCGMTNDSLESLKTHMLTAHMPTQPEDPMSDPGEVAVPQVQTPVPTIISAPLDPSTSSVETQPKAQTVSIPAADKPGRYKCGHCGIIVASMDKLKSHMLTSHVTSQADEPPMQISPSKPVSINTSISRSLDDSEELEDGETTGEIQANKVELNFNVMIPDSELHIFPRHVEPALFFTCKYCDFKSKQYKSVSNHVAACHPKKLAPAVRAQRQEELKGLDVDELEAVSSEKYGPGRAKTRLVKPMPYPCGYCNLSFETQIDQSIHQRCHLADSKAMRCCFCAREAPEVRPWKMLYRHIVTMHPGNVSPKHICKYCGVACMFPHNLKIHMKSEHGIEEANSENGDSVTCEHCQKTFKHASYLKYHLVIRHGIGTAEEKAKITAQSQRKKEQKLINKQHKPLMTCKLCPYQTNDQYRLRTHTEVVHQGVKRHKCGVCNTAFSDYSTLRRHMWRHRDSKPYSCQFCGFTCIQSTQIKSHYKNKHGMSPTDAKKLIRHINGPRHSGSGNESAAGNSSAATAQPQQTIQQQPTHPQQIVVAQQPQHPQQATVIHQQPMQVHHQQQGMPPTAHQVHHRGMEVHVPVSGQGHRTYTVFNDQGMEYTDIQALADAAEGLLAAEQIVIATS